MSRFTLAVAALVLGPALAAGPVDLLAQSPPDSVPRTVVQQYPEVLEAQVALMRLLSQAFEADPGLDTLRSDFERAQEDAMTALDPETPRRRARMAELGALHDQRLATVEAPDVGALLAEGRELRRALHAAAVDARRQPDVAVRADSLAAALELRFTMLDPDAFERLARQDRWIEMVWAAFLVSSNAPRTN